MGSFRRIRGNHSGRPRFMGLFRRIPRAPRLRRLRSTDSFRRKETHGFRRFFSVIAGRDPATQADRAARAALDHRVKPSDDNKRARFMGSFRRIRGNHAGSPRFMGLFRRNPQSRRLGSRFMGSFRRKREVPKCHARI